MIFIKEGKMSQQLILDWVLLFLFKIGLISLAFLEVHWTRRAVLLDYRWPILILILDADALTSPAICVEVGYFGDQEPDLYSV